jgi:hypothetical protein
MKYIDFKPNIKWNNFLCFINCYPDLNKCEDMNDVLERANNWIKTNNIKVLKFETFDYKFDNFSIRDGHIRIWY